MKKLQDDIFARLFILFTLIMTSFLAIVFFLFDGFIQEILLKTQVNNDAVMEQFYFIFEILFSIIVLQLLLVYVLLFKTKKKILEDLNSLSKYLHNISSHKKYDTTLHIKHYLEFLHISVVLKNIVKRLRAKSKKK